MRIPSQRKFVHAKGASSNGSDNANSNDNEAEQKKMVEIMGMEQLSLQRKQNDGKQASTKMNGRNKYDRSKPKGSVATADSSTLKMIYSRMQVGSFSLGALPVVSSSMTDDDLRSELLARNPIVDVSNKGKEWLLDNLKVGTISILKGRETVGADVIAELPKVSPSTMSVEQLRREFLHRHPSKKILCRGKWKDWFIYQLGLGSICVAPVMSKPLAFTTSRKSARSPPASISNTVSTAPTQCSTSPQNSTADTTITTRSGNFSSSFVLDDHHKNNNEISQRAEMPARVSTENKSIRRAAKVESRKKYYDASRAAAKKSANQTGRGVTPDLESQNIGVISEPESRQQASKATTTAPKRKTNKKQKYVKAHRVSRRSLPGPNERGSLADTLLVSKKDVSSNPGSRHDVRNKSTMPDAPKQSKGVIDHSEPSVAAKSEAPFAGKGSARWLSNIKEARKMSRPSVG